jgi:hypothetical protein
MEILAVLFLGAAVGWFGKPIPDVPPCPPPLPPVIVPCKITPPVKDFLPFTNGATEKDDMFDKTKKVLAELKIRDSYELQLEEAITECNK